MKDRICNICHTAIDMNKEFCGFTHYEKKGKIKSKGYYHVNCFRDRLSGSSAQVAVANKALEILDKVGVRVS